MRNSIRNCHRCGKDFFSPYKECLCEACLKELGWESTPQTNADHIRSMTDEELANFLVTKMPGDICDWTDLMLDWLKQPFKE